MVWLVFAFFLVVGLGLCLFQLQASLSVHKLIQVVTINKLQTNMFVCLFFSLSSRPAVQLPAELYPKTQLTCCLGENHGLARTAPIEKGKKTSEDMRTLGSAHPRKGLCGSSLALPPASLCFPSSLEVHGARPWNCAGTQGPLPPSLHGRSPAGTRGSGHPVFRSAAEAPPGPARSELPPLPRHCPGPAGRPAGRGAGGGCLGERAGAAQARRRPWLPAPSGRGQRGPAAGPWGAAGCYRCCWAPRCRCCGRRRRRSPSAPSGAWCGAPG